ncbi:MAG: alpha/beta fold hydrolase [Myxococcales bacterium]
MLAIAGISAAFLRDLAIARAHLVGRSELAETSFGPLEYAVIGEGEPILVVHGAGGGFDQGIEMTQAVTGHGYRIIAPSRFGYLRSRAPDNPTAALQADAYVELLDRLGLDEVAVVGISAGAWSSLQFAVRHSDRCRALVLLVPADHLPAGTANHGGAAVRAVFHSDLVAWAALKLMRILPGPLTRMLLGTEAAVVRAAAPCERARVQRLLAHLLPVGPRAAGMQLDIETAALRQPDLLEAIACPTLAISAEDDGFGTARRVTAIVSHVRNGRAVLFPTGGHALVGHYADALREVTTFLEANRSPRPPARR